MEDLNDNTRNLYIIKRRLAELKRVPPNSYFSYYVGDFRVKIGLPRGLYFRDLNESLVSHDILDVSLWEQKRLPTGKKYYDWIDLDQDSRFAHYKPIKYDVSSDGEDMPLMTLCELCKYLHRLSNLAVFA